MKRKKKNLTMSLFLSSKEIKFLDSLSYKCSRSGFKGLSRPRILRNLVKIAGKLGLKSNIKDCEGKFIECLLRSISRSIKDKIS